MFEPVWNRIYINSIQITMAERFGVRDRGKFYDETGAIRDVLQNHMLQVSMAETKCAKWRRDIVPVGLRERGFEAPVYDCVFVST